MGIVYELLLITSVAVGLYVSFVLLFISKQNRLLNKLLATFLLTMSVFYFILYAVNRDWALDFVILIRTFLPLYYFLPASCYLYFRTYIQDDTSLTKKDLLHLIPIALHIIYISPLIFSILSGDIAWGSILQTINAQTYFYNFGSIPDRYHVLFRLGLMLLYMYLIWKAYLSSDFQQFIEKNRELYPYSIKWIKYYIIAITANGIFSFLLKSQIFFLNTKTVLIYGDVISMCLLISFDLLILYALFNPVILFGLPHFTRFMPLEIAAHQGNEADPQGFSVSNPETEMDSSSIQPSPVITKIPFTFQVKAEVEPEEQLAENIAESELEKMEILIMRMHAYINEHKPFREKEFNVASLSQALQIPQHHLAYIFKHSIKKSFVEFRSELRVNYVIENLKNSMSAELTMEAIGADAGFSSRATFFAVFKKFTGMTPMHYLKNL